MKVPDNIPDKLAAPINCALGTMVNAVSSLVDLDNLEEQRAKYHQKSVLIQVG